MTGKINIDLATLRKITEDVATEQARREHWEAQQEFWKFQARNQVFQFRLSALATVAGSAGVIIAIVKLISAFAPAS